MAKNTTPMNLANHTKSEFLRTLEPSGYSNRLNLRSTTIGLDQNLMSNWTFK